MYDSYIIDWCNFPKLQPCDFQWKRFGPNTSSALINSGERRTIFLMSVQESFMLFTLIEFRKQILWNIELCSAGVVLQRHVASCFA